MRALEVDQRPLTERKLCVPQPTCQRPWTHLRIRRGPGLRARHRCALPRLNGQEARAPARPRRKLGAHQRRRPGARSWRDTCGGRAARTREPRVGAPRARRAARRTEEPRHPPKSPLGSAIRYTLGPWNELGVFLDDARVPLDTNASERSLRRIASYGSLCTLLFKYLESQGCDRFEKSDTDVHDADCGCVAPLRLRVVRGPLRGSATEHRRRAGARARSRRGSGDE